MRLLVLCFEFIASATRSDISLVFIRELLDGRVLNLAFKSTLWFDFVSRCFTALNPHSEEGFGHVRLGTVSLIIG